MLRTKNLITEITEVPREWVFEYYLSLPVLTGQDERIKSVFNSTDKYPSMFIFHKDGEYKFKDFSSGKGGDNIELVKEMFGLSTRGTAVGKIIQDYNAYIGNNPSAYMGRDYTADEHYKIVEHTTRKWIKPDQKFWSQYSIGSKDLAHFNVKALESYLLRKQVGDTAKELLMDRGRMYGFFKTDGTLYKIYQPAKRKRGKFVEVEPFVQGSDKLTFEVPFLVICSSLKDMICLRKMGFKNAEMIAPNSESNPLSEEEIAFYKQQYDGICTLFDNDAAGLKAMKEYETKFDIPYAHLPYEKDLAECVKIHGIKNTRYFLKPILKKALYGENTNELKDDIPY